MPSKTADRAPARERLLAAASELFYEEGVHTVGSRDQRMNGDPTAAIAARAVAAALVDVATGP
jgi:hypothetical protein